VKIPLVDLKAQYNLIKDEINEAIQRVIQAGQFILGPEVKAFEEEIASYCGTRFAIGVASGTDALHLALLACGVKPGNEVITSPFTFIATAEAITNCGAIPVFVDIDPRTYNINPAQIEPKISSKTKTIIPVHLYGQPVKMEPVSELGKRHNLKIIEDCAQALGAEYKGKKVGSLGDAGCLSFFPSKILGAYGDGGMVVTNDPEIAEKVRMLRNHGAKQKYYHLVPGFNSRLDELQAAILRVKLRNILRWILARHQKAALYAEMLKGIEEVETPHQAADARHVFNYYTIRVKKGRDELQKFLSSRGVYTSIYYPLCLHLQEVCRNLGYQAGDFPESERAQEEVLSLPIYPELDDNKIEWVAKRVREFVKEGL